MSAFNTLDTGTISEILPEDPGSWKGRLFLTIDMEWAADATLTALFDWLDGLKVSYTVFVTHQTPLLDRLRHNPRVELGIHPNFNGLLNGSPTEHGRTLHDVLHWFKSLVPEATALRSHCLTSSTLLLQAMPAFGLTHECNSLIPIQSDQSLVPWRGWVPGVTHVPSLWEDDVHCLQSSQISPEQIQRSRGLKVVNFHPVIWRLNIASMDHYQQCKPFYQDDTKLLSLSNKGAGIRTFLEALLQ